MLETSIKLLVCQEGDAWHSTAFQNLANSQRVAVTRAFDLQKRLNNSEIITLPGSGTAVTLGHMVDFNLNPLALKNMELSRPDIWIHIVSSTDALV